MTDSIRAKIEKLLNMTTERGASEAEQMIAMEKAQKLLREHNLSIADVKDTEKKNYREKDIFDGSPWARRIAHAVAELYDCQYRFLRLSGKTEHIFIGRQSNAETSRLIAEYVVVNVLRTARREQRAAGSKHNSFIHSFVQGASERIVDRAQELWRIENADKVREQDERIRKQKEERERFKLNWRNLKPGTYTITTYHHSGKMRRRVEGLSAADATSFCSNLVAKPPEGTYFFYIKCTEGEMASPFSYVSDWLRMPPMKKGREQVASHSEAYKAGTQHGDRIGLRIQVGSSDPAAALGQ